MNGNHRLSSYGIVYCRPGIIASKADTKISSSSISVDSVSCLPHVLETIASACSSLVKQTRTVPTGTGEPVMNWMNALRSAK